MRNVSLLGGNLLSFSIMQQTKQFFFVCFSKRGMIAKVADVTIEFQISETRIISNVELAVTE